MGFPAVKSCTKKIDYNFQNVLLSHKNVNNFDKTFINETVETVIYA